MSFLDLSEALLEVMARGVEEPLPDEAFNGLALRVFEYQCRTNPAYAAFVARRGVEPEILEDWHGVPFLPAQAFKSEALVTGEQAEAQRIFRTSGTTGGSERRGEHHVLDLALYRSSLVPNFLTHVSLGDEPRPVLSLLPSPHAAPDSSLSFMVGEITDRLGTSDSGFFVDADGGIDATGFRRRVETATARGQAVLLLGTAFSFVRFLESAEKDRWKLEVSPGSALMETGGYKGRSTTLARDEFYQSLQDVFGLPQDRMVNEYGMTELLSQFYEPVLTDLSLGKAALDQRFHVGPPWVRSLVLDPLSLKPLPEGETGILAHLDLANLGSVAPVLTEDLGVALGKGFRLLGRNPGSEPRGCSLAMEDFLASRGEGS